MKKLVQIEWRDPANDWPWFWLLGARGEWLILQGSDYPDGSAKHDGNRFLAHKSDFMTIQFMLALHDEAIAAIKEEGL